VYVSFSWRFCIGLSTARFLRLAFLHRPFKSALLSTGVSASAFQERASFDWRFFQPFNRTLLSPGVSLSLSRAHFLQLTFLAAFQCPRSFCCAAPPNGKAEPQHGFAEPTFWTNLPTKPKSRDTMSAEGAVGSSGCWAATYGLLLRLVVTGIVLAKCFQVLNQHVSVNSCWRCQHVCISGFVEVSANRVHQLANAL
jgi:hypothetical protein